MHEERYFDDESLTCLHEFHFNGEMKTKFFFYLTNRGEKHIHFAPRSKTYSKTRNQKICIMGFTSDVLRYAHNESGDNYLISPYSEEINSNHQTLYEIFIKYGKSALFGERVFSLKEYSNDNIASLFVMRDISLCQLY